MTRFHLLLFFLPCIKNKKTQNVIEQHNGSKILKYCLYDIFLKKKYFLTRKVNRTSNPSRFQTLPCFRDQYVAQVILFQTIFDSWEVIKQYRIFIMWSWHCNMVVIWLPFSKYPSVQRNIAKRVQLCLCWHFKSRHISLCDSTQNAYSLVSLSTRGKGPHTKQRQNKLIRKSFCFLQVSARIALRF